MPRLWITPQDLPEGTVSICLTVPDSPVFWGILRALFLDLTNCDNWEYSGGLSPCDAADWALILYDSFEAKDTC